MQDDETEIKGNFATVTVRNDHGPNPECNRGQLYLALEGGNFTGLDANELRDAIDRAVGPREPDSQEDGKPCRPEPIVDAYFGAKGILAAETADVVNHPAHYTAYPVEVIELTEHMNYCRGNIVKYVARAGLKSPDTELEDLRKAQWYIEREIARLEGPEDPEPPSLPGSVKVGPQSTINIATGQPWEADA